MEQREYDMIANERLQEIDALKQIIRRTYLLDSSRRENDAEHSWHLSVMALALAEYAGEPRLNLLRVMQMVVLQDIIEIDAGDTRWDDDVLRDDAPDLWEYAQELIRKSVEQRYLAP